MKKNYPGHELVASISDPERKNVDPLKPSAQVLIALGSIAIHVQEYFSPTGHPFDKDAALTAFKTPGVQEWLAKMSSMGLLPVKR